jgi:glycosyltransferase involved in cell wall biosynthesis
MKISGFTIIRNAIENDYPIVEAIRSILPVVDEMIIAVGDSTDGTEELIRSIDSPKIKIIYSVWDTKTNNQGGCILAVETNKAFQHISADSDWAFYIQGDEVIHEKFHAVIRDTAARYKDDKRIDGLLFNYLHFYGSYDYVGDSRKWYHKEVRIIRNDKSISAYKDAQGFRRNGGKLRVKPVDAWVYHYGWVKSPRQMLEKQRKLLEFWQGQKEVINELMAKEVFDFNEFDSLERFHGTHPAVMHKRIKEKSWDLKIDITKKKFSLKERLLYWYEKRTGRRLFAFRNYRII